MSHSGRLSAVIALWLGAAAPLALLVLGAIDPSAAVRTTADVTRGLGWAVWGLGAAGFVGLAFYPPFLPALRLRLGRAWRRLGTSDAPVREAYARLRQFETGNDLLLVGRHLRERGNVPQAVDFLTRAVAKDPTHVGARYQLALAHRAIGNFQAAADGLQDVLARDPGHGFGQPLLDLAEILQAARMPAEAAELLARFRRLHGDRRAVLLQHARVLAACGQREAGLEALRQAAAPPAASERLSADDALARGRARVALWFGGFR